MRLSFLFLLTFTMSLTVYSQDLNVEVHDPVMIRHKDTYYIFHTGNGIAVKSSRDLKTWKEENRVFSSTPDWVSRTIPKFDGSFWAPDIIFHNGTYFLYYSVSAFGRNTSAIGVATNMTLDQSDPAFKWIDHGMVVQSVPGRDMWNAIDPNISFDDMGKPWLSFGSFWMGIKLVKMKDNVTEVISDSTQRWLTIAARERNWKVDERDAGDAANPELDYKTLYSTELLEANKSMKNGSIEAPFIFKKHGFYYLFVSWDRCCQGVKSTYKIVVGRAKNITGPYVDKQGIKMIHGGGTLLAKGYGHWAALGHPAIYTFEKDYIIYHAYDARDNGKPKLRISELTWDGENWPVIQLGD